MILEKSSIKAEQRDDAKFSEICRVPGADGGWTRTLVQAAAQSLPFGGELGLLPAEYAEISAASACCDGPDLADGPGDGKASGQYKRATLTAALAGCFGLLFVYKYLGFAGELLSNLPGVGTIEVPALVQPLGISFYLFCVTGYLIDVYRGAEAEKSLVDHALMVSFFPAVLVFDSFRRHKDRLFFFV